MNNNIIIQQSVSSTKSENLMIGSIALSVALSVWIAMEYLNKFGSVATLVIMAILIGLPPLLVITLTQQTRQYRFDSSGIHIQQNLKWFRSWATRQSHIMWTDVTQVKLIALKALLMTKHVLILFTASERSIKIIERGRSINLNQPPINFQQFVQYIQSHTPNANFTEQKLTSTTRTNMVVGASDNLFD